MKRFLPILLLLSLPVVAGAQGRYLLGSSAAEDTNWVKGTLRLDRTLKLLMYADSDTAALGVAGNGVVYKLRKPLSLADSGRYATPKRLADSTAALRAAIAALPAPATYTAGYGLALTGGQFRGDTSLLRTVASSYSRTQADAAFYPRTGNPAGYLTSFTEADPLSLHLSDTAVVFGGIRAATPVTSVFGRTGAVTAQSGDYTTSQVTEGTNFYFTDARARAAVAVQVDSFTTAGTYTWTKPAGAKQVYVKLVSGGSGGGSGGTSASGAFSGGAGGDGGGLSEQTVLAAILPGTVTVVVAAGGAGGAAVSATGTNGNTGTAGGASSFWNYTQLPAANGGVGGTTSNVSASNASSSQYTFPTNSLQPTLGGSSSITTGGQPGTITHTAPSGGGGGGGFASGGTVFSGGAGGTIAWALYSSLTNGIGGVAGGVLTGAAGYSMPAAWVGLGGSGGGGGAASATGNGGAGGNGGWPGGGGGAGGSTRNGFSSGKGGDGAAGMVIVITTF